MSKSKIIENYEVIKSSYEGKNTEPFLPSYFVIETSSLCNFSCSICPHQNMPLDRKGKMDMALFNEILKQIKDYAKVIQLYWMGEPLLHGSIFDMISLCKKETQAKIMISTNGSLLTDENIRKLLDAGVDKIIVSMDAADNNEIYSNIRTDGNLAQLNSNVERLIFENKKQNKKAEILLQFIQLHENESERDAFKSKWSDSGCDISFSCLYTWCNQMPELTEKSAFLSPMIGTQRVACSDLWFKACIRFDGKVSLCCFDWNNSVCLGDLKKESVKEVWNNALINQIRSEHRKNIYGRLCKDCDAWAVIGEYETLF